MSTRGSILVKVGRKTFETYNHCDSYPDWLGKEMVRFVQENLDTPRKVQSFRDAMLALKVVKQSGKPTDHEFHYYRGLVEAMYEATDAEHKEIFREPFSLGMERSKTEFYALLREYQGVTGLEAIAKGDLKHWITGKGFIKDSLFCEYAYGLNLNKGTLDLYVGFQNTGKMETRTRSDGSTYEAEKYNPCKLLASIPFAEVTEDKMQAVYKAYDEGHQ